MAPAPTTFAPTRDTLARLLQAKDDASAAFSAAAKACREAKGTDLTIDQRVVLDLREREALSEATAADQRYDEALKAFLVAQQQVAA